MDNILELVHAIEYLAKNVEELEEQCNRHYEISNLLTLTAQAIRAELKKQNNKRAAD